MGLHKNMEEAQDIVLRQEDNCEKCKKSIKSRDRKVLACHKVYHRSCFTCSHCNNLLDPATVIDSNSPLLCKSWYTRDWQKRSKFSLLSNSSIGVNFQSKRLTAFLNKTYFALK